MVKQRNIIFKNSHKKKLVLESDLLINTDYSELKGYIECESPNDKLDIFNGTMKLNHMDRLLSINIRNVIVKIISVFTKRSYS